jgi:hypothetical protein
LKEMIAQGAGVPAFSGFGRFLDLGLLRGRLGNVGVDCRMNAFSVVSRSNRLCLLLLLSLLGACAGKVPPEPFDKFSLALVKLDAGTEDAFARFDQMSEDRFLREAVEETGAGDPDHKVEKLRIKIDSTDPFAWRVEPGLLFLKIEQFKTGAKQMTEALVSYSNLLKELASPELIPVETFDQLAADLNANANDAITTISQESPDADQLALFSTLAAESARLYLEHKRRSDLITALTENQSTVERFATHMQQGVETMADIAAQEYGVEYQEIASNFFQGTSLATEIVRKQTLQNLIALDREYIDDLGTFSTLHHDYGLIPGAHRDLAQSLSNKELQLTSIIALLEAGRRLERNFDQAVVVNKSREAQAVADQALAQARVLEAEADAAQLRAAAAEVEAINAKAKADVDPGNAQKRAKADDLQRTARELRELARVKQASADEARTAALATQVTANEIKARLLSGSK